MNTKKNILIVSGVGGGLFIFLLLALLYDLCGPYRDICKGIYTPIAYIFFSFPFIFLLSLLTYRMHDKVFRAWWNFALWFVPIIIITTIFFETRGGGGGGWGISSGMDEFAILSLLYGILIVTSLVKIVRAYQQSKK